MFGFKLISEDEYEEMKSYKERYEWKRLHLASYALVVHTFLKLGSEDDKENIIKITEETMKGERDFIDEALKKAKEI